MGRTFNTYQGKEPDGGNDGEWIYYHNVVDGNVPLQRCTMCHRRDVPVMKWVSENEIEAIALCEHCAEGFRVSFEGERQWEINPMVIIGSSNPM